MPLRPVITSPKPLPQEKLPAVAPPKISDQIEPGGQQLPATSAPAPGAQPAATEQK
jgi:hypothetical protein